MILVAYIILNITFIKHNGKQQGCIFVYINEVSRILQIWFIMA